MANKNGSTPQGLTAEQIKLLEGYYALSPEGQAAYLAEKKAAKKQLIQLDFHEYAMEELLHDLWSMAKAGEIDGLVFAVRRTARSGEPYMFGSGGRLSANQAEGVGAAVLLQHKLAGAA